MFLCERRAKVNSALTLWEANAVPSACHPGVRGRQQLEQKQVHFILAHRVGSGFANHLVDLFPILAGIQIQVREVAIRLPCGLDLLFESAAKFLDLLFALLGSLSQRSPNIVFSFAEDRLKAANGVFEEPYPLIKDLQNPLFDRSSNAEVENLNGLFLADSVNAADPLFDSHRIPWHVIVDEDMCELQIPSLAPGFGCDKRLSASAIAEPLDC